MSSVHAALRSRFNAPEWALFMEVRSAAGFDARRTADAVAMNQWPSRGLEIHGVEVKVSRSDWLRELKDPSKSAPIQTYCDRWWVAVSDASIVKDGELPPTWGLLVLRGDKLVQKVEAPKLDAAPLTRTFVASLLRNAVDAAGAVVPRSEVDAIVQERTKEHRESLAERHRDEMKSAHEKADRDGERIRLFQEVSGVLIDEYTDPQKIGSAVRFVMQNRDGLDGGLKHARSVLENLIVAVDRARIDLQPKDVAS